MPDHAKAVQLIDLLLDFFGPEGERWHQRTYRKGKRRCLVDAIYHLRRKHHIHGEGTVRIIYENVRPKSFPPAPALAIVADDRFNGVLMSYNDRCANFAELRAMLIRVRTAAQREQAAAARKRELLADISLPARAGAVRRAGCGSPPSAPIGSVQRAR
jgi:hypothetical protein